MDLLGSIMSSMDKPPTTTTEEQRKKNQERKVQMQKWKQAEDKRIAEFKSKIRSRIENFVKNAELQKLTFEPMSNVDRSILRGITEDAGLVSFSFGQEEVDRHVVIWKKEFTPSEDEIAVLKRGEVWTTEKALEIKLKREEMQAERLAGTRPSSSAPAPKTDYHDKYNHIVSREVGKDAAKDVSANRQYGNVRIENKQDRRTIEETMADRRIKKQKLTQTASSGPADSVSSETAPR